MLSRIDAISCGIFASTFTLPNHDGVFLFRAGERREAGVGSSPSHCEYSTSVMDRTVIPSCAVRVLILRYIVSGMSSVVLMADIIPNLSATLQYGFMDLCILSFAELNDRAAVVSKQVSNCLPLIGCRSLCSFGIIAAQRGKAYDYGNEKIVRQTGMLRDDLLLRHGGDGV